MKILLWSPNSVSSTLNKMAISIFMGYSPKLCYYPWICSWEKTHGFPQIFGKRPEIPGFPPKVWARPGVQCSGLGPTTHGWGPRDAHSQAAIVSWWKIMKNDKKWWKMMKNDEKWWESELKVPYYPYFQTIFFSDAMILWMVAEEILHDQTDGWNPINPINNGINHLYTWLCQLYSTVCLVCMLLADLICNLFNPNLKEVRIMEGTWRYSSFLRIIL